MAANRAKSSGSGICSQLGTGSSSDQTSAKGLTKGTNGAQRKRGKVLIQTPKYQSKRVAFERPLAIPAVKSAKALIRFRNPRLRGEARGCTSSSCCGEPTHADAWSAGIDRG